MYYFIYFIGLLFASFKDKYRILEFLFITSLLFLAFFRYGIGPDYFSYKYLYERLSNSFLDEINNGSGGQEILFRLIGVGFKKLNIPYQIYISFFSLVNIFYTYKIVHKYSTKSKFSFFLYFCFFYFTWALSGIRQGTTLVIGLYYLLEYKVDRKLVKFSFIISLLFFIHYSVIIIPIIHLLTKMKLNKRKHILIFLISLVISFSPLFYFIATFIAKYIPFFARGAYYIPDSFSFLNIIDFSSLVRLLFLILGIYFYNYFREDRIKKYIFDFYLISLDLYFIFVFSEGIGARLSLYGFFLIIIIIPDIIALFKNKLNKVLIFSLILLLSFMWLNKEIDASTMKVIYNNDRIFLSKPYPNILNKKEYEFYNIYDDLIPKY